VEVVQVLGQNEASSVSLGPSISGPVRWEQRTGGRAINIPILPVRGWSRTPGEARVQHRCGQAFGRALFAVVKWKHGPPRWSSGDGRFVRWLAAVRIPGLSSAGAFRRR
jgi:hypothetical protein